MNVSPKTNHTRSPLTKVNATTTTSAAPSTHPSIPAKPSSVDGKHGNLPPTATKLQSGNTHPVATKLQSGNTHQVATKLQSGNTPSVAPKLQHGNTPPPVTKLQPSNKPKPVAKLQASNSVDVAKLQSHENENDPHHIYDEVYQQAPQIKDLKKFFGATPTPATETVETNIGPAKGFFAKKHDHVPLNQSYPPAIPTEKPPKKSRKPSKNRTANNDQMDDASPYAVSAPLHSGNKVINRKKKTSQTSADRSGDSGIAPGIQMLEVPKNIRTRKNGGSTKSEDSDFGSTASDAESGSEGWDSWDSCSDSQVIIQTFLTVTNACQLFFAIYF